MVSSLVSNLTAASISVVVRGYQYHWTFALSWLGKLLTCTVLIRLVFQILLSILIANDQRPPSLWVCKAYWVNTFWENVNANARTNSKWDHVNKHENILVGCLFLTTVIASISNLEPKRDLQFENYTFDHFTINNQDLCNNSPADLRCKIIFVRIGDNEITRNIYLSRINGSQKFAFNPRLSETTKSIKERKTMLSEVHVTVV